MTALGQPAACSARLAGREQLRLLWHPGDLPAAERGGAGRRYFVVEFRVFSHASTLLEA